MRLTPLALPVYLLALALPLGAEEPAAEIPPEVKAALDGLLSEDREQRQHAAEAATGLQHAALFAPLQKLVKDEYRSVREPAVRALGARQAPDEQPKAARTLEARLKDLDRRPEGAEGKPELLALVQALHDLAQPSSIEPLLDALEATTEVDVANARLRAVANVPSKEAVERLIAYAARGRRGESHRGAALKALEYATGVKLPSLDAWHRWWAENRRAFDPLAAARVRAEERAAALAKEQERDERRAKRAERKPGEEPPKGPAEGEPAPGAGGS